MHCVYSDGFDYDEVDYIIECDASYSEIKNRYTIAWLVLDNPIENPLFEGRTTGQSSTTVESEIEAIKESIKEVSKVSNLKNLNLIIRTDYEGIIEYMKNEERDEIYKGLEEQLEKLSNWCIENKPREEISRVHDLANRR